MPTFGGQSEEFERLQDLSKKTFQKKIHNHETENDKTNYFRPLSKGNDVPNFKSISSPTREKFREAVADFL